MTRCLYVLLAFVFASHPLHAKQIFVDPNAGGAQNGTTWNNAFHTLQEGINAAASAAIADVLVAQGTYHPNPGTTWPASSTDPRDATVLMLEGVSIRGGYLGTAGGAGASTDSDNPDGSFARTIISGNAGSVVSYHVIVNNNYQDPAQTLDGLSGTQEAIDGFVVEDGRADGGGADDDGGGLYHTNGANTLVENVTLRDNWAESEGGGVFRNSGGAGRFDCRFSLYTGNHAAVGAGLCLPNSSQFNDLCNVRFEANGANSDSVIVHPVGVVPQCLQGGAIWIGPQVLMRMSNAVLYGNVAESQGAGIYWFPVQDTEDDNVMEIELRHNTLSANSIASSATGDHGAGIYIAPGPPGDCMEMGSSVSCRRMLIYNSILWRNGGGGNSVDLMLDALGGTGIGVEMRYDDIGTFVDNVTMPPGGIDFDGSLMMPLGPTNISAEPEFSGPAAGNLRLKSISPCINAASAAMQYIGSDFLDIDLNMITAEALPLDLDLNPRNVNGFPDMGAYERP